MLKLIFSIVLIATALARPVIASEEASLAQQVDKLFAKYSKTNSPGLAVGIYHKGKVLYTQGYGMADLEHDVAITPESIFHVASVSKQFTAFAIALLVRQGKIQLDEDIRHYLSYVPDFGSRITVRHLLYHTSGLRDQWGLFRFGGQDMDGRLRQQQIVNMVSLQRGLNYKPGAEFSYSNTGYTLLAEIVESVSGKTLRAFCAEYIFAPLNMQQSFFYDDVTELIPNRANSYAYKNSTKTWHRDLLNYDNVGATSLHTTVGDMLKWAKNFSRPKVGDAALIQQISAKGWLDDHSPQIYGFGLMQMQLAGYEVLMHTGSDSGFKALFVYIPDSDFAVTILANTAIERMGPAQAIIKAVLGERELPITLPAKIETSQDALQKLPGVYVAAYGGPMHITKRDNDSLAMAGRVLQFREDGSFDTGDAARVRGYYRLLESEAGTQFQIEQRDALGKKLRYRKAVDTKLSESDLLEFVGAYRSTELDITYDITVQEGQLSVTALWFPRSYTLKAVDKDRFSGAGMMSELSFIRDKNGNIRTVLISDSGRVRKLRFNRVLH